MDPNPERASPGLAAGTARGGWARPAFLLPAALVLAADLASKAWAFAFLETHGHRGLAGVEYPVWPGFFHLARVENTGTIWGLFPDGTVVLTVLRVLMVAVLLWFAAHCPPARRLRLVSLGLVSGGALGNLYDNLFWKGGAFAGGGAVRDFLDFYIPLPWRPDPYHYPTFNLADASILCGAVLLFVTLSREERAVRGRHPGAAPGGRGGKT